MTGSEKSTEKLSLPLIALELFKGRSLQPGVNPRQLAIDCFRDATVFVAAAQEVQSGNADLFIEETNPLDLAYAPNLKRTHPINLMSRAWGNLQKVQAALADLDAHPSAEFYEPYGWGKPEINQARALFPAVVSRAKQLASTK